MLGDDIAIIEKYLCTSIYNVHVTPAWQRIKTKLMEGAPSASDNSAITPPENRDCDTCANDGLCYVTRLKCRGYMRAAQ
jgi:hypothetical protein